MADAAVLLDIFQRAREFVARPENDFSWSSWSDMNDALEELDGIIARLHAGDVPLKFDMSILFAPTGPMQELALSSGWGNRFLGLASEFDAAFA